MVHHLNFFWLASIFNLELIIEDHDLHHRRGYRTSGNYGKQSLIWDNLFGTVLPREECTKNSLQGKAISVPLWKSQAQVNIESCRPSSRSDLATNASGNTRFQYTHHSDGDQEITNRMRCVIEETYFLNLGLNKSTNDTARALNQVYFLNFWMIMIFNMV